jgi:hypothetical protein
MQRRSPLRAALIAATVAYAPAGRDPRLEEPRWAATLYGGVPPTRPGTRRWPALGPGLSGRRAGRRRPLDGLCAARPRRLGRVGGGRRGARRALLRRSGAVGSCRSPPRSPACGRRRASPRCPSRWGCPSPRRFPKLERANNGGSSATLVYWGLEAEARPLPGSAVERDRTAAPPLHRLRPVRRRGRVQHLPAGRAPALLTTPAPALGPRRVAPCALDPQDRDATRPRIA